MGKRDIEQANTSLTPSEVLQIEEDTPCLQDAAKYTNAIEDGASANKVAKVIKLGVDEAVVETKTEVDEICEEYTITRMFQIELLYPIRENHLDKQPFVTKEMRAKMFDALYSLHKYCLLPGAYHVAVGIIDRYLQKVELATMSELKLLTVTAAKLMPQRRSDLRKIMDDLHAYFSDYQISMMEVKLSETLQCDIPHVTPFLRNLSTRANLEIGHLIAALYYIDVCSLDYSLASCKPSQMAAAAVYYSFQQHGVHIQNPIRKFDMEKYWETVIRPIAHYSSAQLQQTVQKMKDFVVSSHANNLRAVFPSNEHIRTSAINLTKHKP